MIEGADRAEPAAGDGGSGESKSFRSSSAPEKPRRKIDPFSVLLLCFMLAVVVFSFILGTYTKSCEIASIQNYISQGGKIVANSSGIFDYGISGLNLTR